MPWSRGEPPWEERPPARARCSAPAPASVRYEFRTQATVCGVVHGAVGKMRVLVVGIPDIDDSDVFYVDE